MKHKKAAALGKLVIHPDKLVTILIRKDGMKKYEMFVDGVKVKGVEVEKFLGSRFTGVYDDGELNIKTRIMIAKTMEKTMERIFRNREMDIEMKLDFYRSDIASTLLHGAEYWHMSEKNINMVERCSRRILLEMVGRNEADHIKSTDLYRWMHERGKELYPIRFVLAERKLRYFGTIERGDRNELARKMFWCDFKTHKVKDAEFEYQHMRDIKKALEILNITEKEMNENYKMKKRWERLLKKNKKVAFEQWGEKRDKVYLQEKIQEVKNGDYKKKVKQMVPRKGNKTWYKMRTLPS